MSQEHRKRTRVTQEDRQQKIPVSLGKPSLRLRLEAYYKLIAPDQIANFTEWRTRVDQIWDKFGGSHEGEKKLATKLAKKYGSNVRLELAVEQEDPHKRDSTSSTNMTLREWFSRLHFQQL
jgi:hypothetical protein